MRHSWTYIGRLPTWFAGLMYVVASTAFHVQQTDNSSLQDVYSYNMEQSRGIGGNNIVTVLMQARRVDLQAASDLVGQHFKHLMDKFTEGKRKLPSWDLDVDTAVAAYVKAMEHWIIGNLDWSFETQRYFGPQHAEVKRSLMVTLRPRNHGRA